MGRTLGRARARRDKLAGQAGAKHSNAQSTVAQRLVVIGDRRCFDGNAERLRDVQSVVTLWQLPQTSEQSFGCAAREHDLVAVGHPQRGAGQHWQLALLLASSDDGQLVLASRARGDAVGSERADQAAWRGRRAQRRAELHEALVEVTGRVIGRQRGHQLAGALPERALARGRLDVVVDRAHASEHARDVAIDEWRALAIRDRRDRAGGVRPDAGHAAQLARKAWQCACECRRDRLCTCVQVARARVVAEPGPRGEHVVERRRGERVHRRKLRHPPLPVGNHGLDARLLQHDLADPDRVGIARTAPGQVAAVTLVVRDDSSRDASVVHRVVVPRLVVQVDHRADLRHEDHAQRRLGALGRRVLGDLTLRRRVLDQRVGHAHAELPVPR